MIRHTFKVEHLIYLVILVYIFVCFAGPQPVIVTLFLHCVTWRDRAGNPSDAFTSLEKQLVAFGLEVTAGATGRRMTEEGEERKKRGILILLPLATAL